MQQKRGKKGGQLASLDLILSGVIFATLFIFLISTWSLFSARLNEEVSSEDLQLVAFQTLDFLVRSRGMPDNWEENPNASQLLGLHFNYGSLDSSKLSAFLSLDYNLSRGLLKIKRFDYYFRVANLNGTIIGVSGLPPDGKASVGLTRLVLVENEPQKILFTLWN